MSILLDILYALALIVLLPVLAVKSLRTGKYRKDFSERLGRYRAAGPLEPHDLTLQKNTRRRLLMHCVSVGELNSMRGLIDRLLAEDPTLAVVISTTTDTGTARARERYAVAEYQSRVMTLRFPWDFSFAVRAFLDRAAPDLIVLAELETWPNLLRIAQKRGIPVVIANGRISERSYPRYRLIRPVMAAMLRRLTWIGAQTPTIARRFTSLGAPAERVDVIPTIKYDAADLADTIPGADALAAACGISREHTLFVGGSTGPGEEQVLLAAYATLRGAHPSLRLAIATRHPEVVPQVVRAIESHGLRAVLRTSRRDGATPPAPLSGDQVLVLDTMGELKKLYSLAAAVFVGRSLVKLGGSDMIEVAALGKPCCFGPYTSNFAEAVELLTGSAAATTVSDGGALKAWLAGCLDDPAGARAQGEKARAIIAAQRGSTERYVRKLRELLAPKQQD